MIVYKCDVCKRIIQKKAERFSVTSEGDRYHSYLFCEKCGKPIADFLTRNGLGREKIKKRIASF